MSESNVVPFPSQKVRITKTLLCDLTSEVIRQRPDIKNVFYDFLEYCALLGIKRSAQAHHDWAMERLGRTQHKALA